MRETYAMATKSSETIRVLEDHVSVRKFRPDPVAPECLELILRAACRAPTSSNLQAYSLVLVNDTGTRGQLAGLAGNQKHVNDAPVFIAVCAVLSKAEQASSPHAATFHLTTLQ